MKTPWQSIFFISLFLIVNILKGQTIDEDSVLRIPSNRFFQDYLNKGIENPILNPPFGFKNIKISKKYGLHQFFYHFIKKKLYLTLDKTGKVFQMVHMDDSIMTFKRIDLTESENYNIGAFVFTNDDELYSYGGYGFWKTNGALRKYNFKIREWDIVKLNKEIIAQYFPTQVLWYDPDSDNLYVFYQRIVNEGLNDNEYVMGKLIDESYKLDLKTSNWERIGRPNPKIIKLFSQGASSLNGNKGMIIITIDYNALWFDVKNNVAYNIGNSVQLEVLKKIFNNCFSYLHDSTIFYYNFENNIYDSLKLDLKNSKASFQILNYDQNISNKSPLILLLILIPVGIIILYLNQKKPRKEKEEILYKSDSTIELAPLEKNLINLLIDKKGNPCSVQDVNYVLGLKNKNVGLQKKVRSDVINSINEKYFMATGSKALLIQSIRSESDKRIFEYIIDMNRANEFLKEPN